MVKISGTSIKMTRGDTLRLTLGLTDEDGNDYTPLQGDKIRFAMKQNYNDSTPLIVKDIPISTMQLVLNPEDTQNLPQPSTYVYDLEITYANGDVESIRQSFS